MRISIVSLAGRGVENHKQDSYKIVSNKDEALHEIAAKSVLGRCIYLSPSYRQS